MFKVIFPLQKSFLSINSQSHSFIRIIYKVRSFFNEIINHF